MTVDDLDFLHTPGRRITRHSTSVKTGRCTRETIYVITSLTSAQASPQRMTLIVWATGDIPSNLAAT